MSCLGSSAVRGSPGFIPLPPFPTTHPLPCRSQRGLGSSAVRGSPGFIPLSLPHHTPTALHMRLGLSGKESPFYKRENWEPREQRKKAVSPGSLDQGDVNSDTRSQGQASGKPIDLPGLPAAHRSLALPGQAGLSVGSLGISRPLEARKANPGVGKGW